MSKKHPLHGAFVRWCLRVGTGCKNQQDIADETGVNVKYINHIFQGICHYSDHEKEEDLVSHMYGGKRKIAGIDDHAKRIEIAYFELKTIQIQSSAVIPRGISELTKEFLLHRKYIDESGEPTPLFIDHKLQQANAANDDLEQERDEDEVLAVEQEITKAEPISAEIRSCFEDLNFEIELDISVAPKNAQTADGKIVYDLLNFAFTIGAAPSEVEVEPKDDGEPRTLRKIRIGFSRARLTILNVEDKPYGNYICGRPTVESDGGSENVEGGSSPEQEGQILLKAKIKSISWQMTPKEKRKFLDGLVRADFLCDVVASVDTPIIAVLTVSGDALDVRGVHEVDGKEVLGDTEQIQTDIHRDAMRRRLIRKQFPGFEEYVLHEQIIHEVKAG